MIKVFTVNKDNKIELTKEELKAILDEAYWDGYKSNSHTYVYNSPGWEPYKWTITTAGSTCGETDTTITCSNAVVDNDFSVGVNA